MLGHQFQVFRTNHAIAVRDLEPGVWEREVSIVHMQAKCRGDGRASLIGGSPVLARFVERHVGTRLQLVVQDHTSNVFSRSEQIGLGLAHHPVQTRVVPDFCWLDPPGVVDLADVARRVAMVIEQRFAGVRDTHDVRDGAIPKPCYGPALEEPLSLE
jgi:hypothetical protein